MTPLLESPKLALLDHATFDRTLSDLDGWSVRAAPASALRVVQQSAAGLGVDRSSGFSAATAVAETERQQQRAGSRGSRSLKRASKHDEVPSSNKQQAARWQTPSSKK
jgi:hypothetical protein